MMLVFGRGRLVDGTIDASCCNDDCDAAAAAAVGENVLLLLLGCLLRYPCCFISRIEIFKASYRSL